MTSSLTMLRYLKSLIRDDDVCGVFTQIFDFVTELNAVGARMKRAGGNVYFEYIPIDPFHGNVWISYYPHEEVDILPQLKLSNIVKTDENWLGKHAAHIAKFMEGL